PWVLHGYRGKPELTRQLVRKGFFFSVGDDINVESMELIPIENLFCETDEDVMDIRDVYAQAAQAVNMEIEEFAAKIAQNIHRIFPTLKAPKPFDPEEDEEVDD